ncbi:hypothetical protein BTUL_0016g00400 [Botrytis tulipae]|uniref:Uncharacterized protein n=1 Tax=Botrytis tulipae TaxID=87230 RepID=A0A4Z1F8I3_9HELO|nr:hypothetical protein BTUL_0016g00400 [Botrytis tulipae]
MSNFGYLTPGAFSPIKTFYGDLAPVFACTILVAQLRTEPLNKGYKVVWKEQNVKFGSTS